MRILDLGCGPKKVTGALGVDRRRYPGVDLVADLNRYPWPLSASAFDEVHLNSSLEHLDDTVRAIQEVWRIAAPGARVFINVPHFSSADCHVDVTHRRGFSWFSFDRFLLGEQDADPTVCAYRMVRRRIEMWPLCGRIRIKPYWLVERLANAHPTFYERFLAFLCPARSLHVEMDVVKDPGV